MFDEYGFDIARPDELALETATSEDRTFEVAAEDRFFDVPAEDRFFDVEA